MGSIARRCSFVLCFLLSSTSFADKGDMEFDVGFGVQAPYGFLGAAGRYFIDERIDLHVTAGIDFNGGIVGAGSRLYSSVLANQCLFVFLCEARMFAGATLVRSNGTTGNVTANGVTDEFTQSPGLALVPTIGVFDSFESGFTMGVDIGYRAWLQRPSVDFGNGSLDQADKDKVVAVTSDTIAVGVTFGLKF